MSEARDTAPRPQYLRSSLPFLPPPPSHALLGSRRLLQERLPRPRLPGGRLRRLPLLRGRRALSSALAAASRLRVPQDVSGLLRAGRVLLPHRRVLLRGRPPRRGWSSPLRPPSSSHRCRLCLWCRGYLPVGVHLRLHPSAAVSTRAASSPPLSLPAPHAPLLRTGPRRAGGASPLSAATWPANRRRPTHPPSARGRRRRGGRGPLSPPLWRRRRRRRRCGGGAGSRPPITGARSS